MLTALLKQLEQLGFQWLLQMLWSGNYVIYALRDSSKGDLSVDNYDYMARGETPTDTVDALLKCIQRLD